jgi:hypothetical protein
MSALDKSPQNQNFQSPLNFKFFVKRAPYLNFFVQKTAVPEVSIDPTWQPTPFTAIPQAGDHISYTPFSVTFKVDEDLKNYVEMHDWLRSIGFPDSYDEYLYNSNRPSGVLDGLTSDLSLLILTNAKNPSFEATFIDAFPIYLSGLEFNTTDDTVNFIEATVTFRYTSFYIASA